MQRQGSRYGVQSPNSSPFSGWHAGVPEASGASPQRTGQSPPVPSPQTRTSSPFATPTRQSSRGSGHIPQGPSSSSADRWRFLLLLLAAAALWLLGMRVVESRWDANRAASPFAREVALQAATTHLYEHRLLVDAASRQGISLRQPGEPLGVCIMTADFWGAPTAGGTATAYHLLAETLSREPSLKVTFLAVSKRQQDCEAGAKQVAEHGVEMVCLEKRHFEPEVVETYPYEMLSHAVLAWVVENIAKCDVIHAHEWGGVFSALATVANYRQLKPGLRLAIESHGGHFWSTQGQVQRPLDVTSLRIDHGERITLQLASALISPTHYMTAFLQQRGWRLPPERIVIPNVVPPIEEGVKPGDKKAVWRLAFFSRLEERKGLKLFVEAVNRLIEEGVSDRFEVFFVGAEAHIDMRTSGEWIKQHTAAWKFPVHIRVNMLRDDAMTLLSQEGVLLVLCSLIDNMPYVVAEAASRGIPFLVFDVGGVLEMFDPRENKGVVVWEPTAEALTAKLSKTMQLGSIQLVALNSQVTHGREQWLEWHQKFADTRSMKLQSDDIRLAAEAVATEPGHLQVVRTSPKQHALELWEAICLPRGTADGPLLLMTEEYEMLDSLQGPEMLIELLQMGVLNNNGIGALTFGAKIPSSGKISYPTGPTWMLYAGDDSRCNQNVPVLIRKDVFCDTYLAEARVFRTYYSWILSMLLGQAGLRMHTYPTAMFRVNNFTTEGYSCMADKAPTDRHLTFNSASNLYANAEEVLINLHLAPFPRPSSSIVDDFPTEQSHKGWQIGYQADDDEHVRPLTFYPAASGADRDGRWACGPGENDYPALQHSLAHPCAGGGTSCCGFPSASLVVRFESFFASERAVLIMAYEVWPICGDGLDMSIVLTSLGSEGRPVKHVLAKQGFDANEHEQPQRQKMEFRFHLHVSDWVDLLVHPRGNHDCDGMYLVDMQLWQDDGLSGDAEDRRAPPDEENTPKVKKAVVGKVEEGDGVGITAARKGMKPGE